MSSQFRFWSFKTSPFIGILLLAVTALCQDASTPLLKLQRSKAYLELETNVVHAQGLNGITYGKGGDVSNYPNSLACLLVYGDGKFVLEKRDESTLGKPKVKIAEGSLTADDLQHLKGMLDDEGLKKVVSPAPPELPANAAAIREIESVDAQIDRGGTLQRFTTIKERVKMAASETGGVTTGMDTYLDNGAHFQKTLNPLLKWFDGLEKKNKSQFKDSSPKYCAPMNVG
ncbi:MAG: hypothetical protein WA172_10415 [Terriglobales bacterium]